MNTTISLQAPVQRANWLGSIARLLPGDTVRRDMARDVRRARKMAADRWCIDPRTAADLSAAIDRFEQQHGLA